LTHIHTYGILANEQSGFHVKLSTKTASYNLNEVLISINNKRKVGVFLLYLLKALDCIHHEILNKLEFYGITDNIYIS
jgi:hypothetical protein